MSESTSQRARWRVLVIDDEPAIGRLIKNLLSKHDVEITSSGEVALARLREGAPYDVMVCDLMMPGMSGIDLYTRIAAEHPGLERRIVFVTGGAFTERAASFLESIPNRKLEKPFAIGGLEEAMAATIADGQGSR